MKYGRRLTAVGLLTGGLLLVGFAAPSLADVGSTAGATGTDTSSVTTTDAGSSADTTAGNTAADPTAQPQDATRFAALADAPNADDPNGDPIDECVAGDPTSCPKGLYCALFPDDEFCQSPPDDGCPPGQTDYNGSDPGCGTPPDDGCPDGQTDYNGPDPGCGTPPDNGCPPGQTDYNGPLADGCGTPPDNGCPAGQTDYNGPLADGCGTAPDNGGNGNGGNPPGQSTPPPSNGGGSSGNQGPGTGAGGSSSSNGSGSEGTVPGATRPHRSPGTSACGDPAICNDSGILGVDASSSIPTTTSPSTVAGTGRSLPETGAPADTQGLLVVGFGLLAAGVLLVRPRRPARHRAA